MRINSNIFTAITIFSTRTFVILSSFFLPSSRTYITSSVKHYEPLKNANIRIRENRELFIFENWHESCCGVFYNDIVLPWKIFENILKNYSSEDSQLFLMYIMCHVESQLRENWVCKRNNQLKCKKESSNNDRKQISRHSIVPFLPSIQYDIILSTRCTHYLTRDFINLFFLSLLFPYDLISIIIVYCSQLLYGFV